MKETNTFIPFGGPDVHTDDMAAAAAIVLPICYEVGASYGTGSGQGPFHLLTASVELETMDEEMFVDWGEIGIHTVPAFVPSETPEAAVEEIKNKAGHYLDTGKFVLALGGDHAITIGLAAAVAQRYPEVGILQIDAHLDLRNEYHGSRYNHACVMRRVAEDIRAPFVQVGIRSFSPEEAAYIRANDIRPFFAHETADPSDNVWMDAVIERLPETVYVSLDLDGLDPSFVPGTGTPEPGGLTYRQVVELIRRLGLRRRVVAADINELAKIEGTQVSEFTAAKLATKMFVHFLK